MQSRLLYSLFLGLLIMTMATVAISAYVPPPDYPDISMVGKEIQPPEPPRTISNVTIMGSEMGMISVAPLTGTPVPAFGKTAVATKAQRDEDEKMQKRWERYYKLQDEYTQKVQEAEANADEMYSKNYDVYVENTLLLHIGVAVILIFLGLVVLRALPGITDGVVLGGTLLLIYHLGKSLWEGGYEIVYSPVTVIAIAGAVALTAVVGYIRFARTQG